MNSPRNVCVGPFRTWHCMRPTGRPSSRARASKERLRGAACMLKRCARGARCRIADRYCSRHADAMGREPAERTAPDLFPASASSLPKKATTESEPQRYVLPKNLRNAVKHLSDGELDLMHAATLEEMKRRGRDSTRRKDCRLHARPDATKPKLPPTEKRRHANAAEVSLTRGRVNALRYRRDRQRQLALQEPNRRSHVNPRSPHLRNPDQLRRGER